MEPLVSVAIAIYNVEKFIYSGIKCILNQTYKNIEILLVDDGSTDNSPSLCDELANKYENIKVIHKKNGGAGSARNIGIENASGKYIYFFDIDDSVEDDFIEYAVFLAEKEKYQFMIFGYYVKIDGEDNEEKITIANHDIKTNEELRKVYLDELRKMKHGNGFVWNKFYLMSFLNDNNFRFGNQRIQQDEPFNMLLYLKANRVFISSKAFYHYVIYKSGNAGTRYLDNKLEILKDVNIKFLDFYEQLDIEDNDFYISIYQRFYSGICNVLIVNTFHKEAHNNFFQKYKIIKNTLCDVQVKKCINIVDKHTTFIDKCIKNEYILLLIIYNSLKIIAKKILRR